MRNTMLTFGLALALLATLAPLSSASHMGPCTHEYAEIVIYGVMDYKNGGLGRIPAGVLACVLSSGGDLIGDSIVLP